ncbi:DUF692 domain-containing protein [Marinobacterium lutimaris]|uniref:Uncharacterized protein n=1 Tax=Marinobacterium lutimaris TaxID=568106 RepID=A0A1H5VJW3_9GAMM|nr:DUF692 domain-containing protein [Marinobacterium lutimaris]SEF87622.1 hypothetical protein SAMN05444390_101758 [Marinobacterium lutimaris]
MMQSRSSVEQGSVKGSKQNLMIGVGLRHAHFQEALANPAALDFVEVHSENFFGNGGAARAVLLEVAEHYPVSLHSTAMGLGSECAIPEAYLLSLWQLIESVSPVLVSDHAAFTWGEFNANPVHAGDLLPLAYNAQTVELMAGNIRRFQHSINRRLLVENVSTYLAPAGSTLSEPEFLTAVVNETGCGLLVDLNNIVVNARNSGTNDVLGYARAWLDKIPAEHVGELHLAGYSDVKEGDLVIDDHARPVSEEVWLLYAHALQRFGAVPTLIEWDNELPTWQVLVSEADKARSLAQEVLTHAE